MVWAIAIVGSLITIIGSLIIYNLSCIKKFIYKQDIKIEEAKKDVQQTARDMLKCKVDCERNFVDTPTFLRETGFQRRTLQTISASVNEMKGSLKVVEKMPQISGSIAREIIKEMKNGDKQ